MAGSEALDRAEIVALADLNGNVPQDGIGDRVMEKELRHLIVQQVVAALHRTLFAARGELHRPVGTFGNGLGIERLNELDGLGDARLQLVEAFLLVDKFRHFDAGKPGAGTFREIGSKLDLGLGKLDKYSSVFLGEKFSKVELRIAESPFIGDGINDPLLTNFI